MRFGKRHPAVFFCFIIGFLLLFYYIFLCSFPGHRHLGVTLVGVHSIVFLSAGWFLWLHHKFPSKRALRLFRGAAALFFCWLLSLAVLSGVLMFHGPTPEIKDPDYLVILGAGLNGEQPGLTLRERLATGLNYLRKHPELQVIVSGGQGPGETISEAQAMGAYLIEQGISEDRIIYESRSQSTMENFLFTSALIQTPERKQPWRIAVVTSDFHILRAQMLAKRNGFLAGAIPAPTPRYLLPANLLRECFAFVKSIFLDR